MNNDNIYKNIVKNNEIQESEIPWHLIQSYFKNKHLKQLIKHQLESYNYFVSNQIEKTINMFNPVHICSEHDYIKEHGIHRLEMYINFINFNINRPQVYENNGSTKIMFPHEARLRNFTYSGNMIVDLDIKCIVRNGENYSNVNTYQKIIKKIHIGKLPIMLRSDICVLNQFRHLTNNETGECYMDPGGYFIINGSEKTCLAQERASENITYCYNVQKNNTKWSWSAEMKSIPDWKCISPKQINILISTKNNSFGNPLYLQIPRLKNPIPLFIIFRAFNIISDKDICDTILLNIEDKKLKKMKYALKASIVEANTCLDYDSAIKYIISNVIYTPLNVDKETGNKKKHNFALEVINNDIFPHCKTDTQKIFMLGYMTNILLQTSFGWIPETDRDSYINKRIDLTGTLLNNLLRNYLNKLVKDMQKQIIREINNGSWKSNEEYNNIINNTNIYKIIKSTTIENGIKRALATGDFGIKQINSNKVGVAQVLNRLTYISSISHLRRVNTPIDKSGKLVPPRRLHNSCWGFICPAETPEGAAVGIVKNLSYMTHISISSDSNVLYEYILPLIDSLDDIKFSNNKYLYDNVKVFINGSWIGITKEPIELYNNLKEKKYKGIINVYTSIIFDIKMKEIRICNDAGRLIRPLFRVENNKLLYTLKNNVQAILDIKNNNAEWDDLIYSGKYENSIIEYIDIYEQEHSMIAMEKEYLENKSDKNYIYKYSHCEIHPSTIFGVLASCIPFPENNQSPRNTYQSAMGKQAIGVYVTNFDNRMDKTSYVLTYPMRPLVDTRLMNLIKLNEIPSGEQVIVAIASHSGYNQEDSILFNKSSIDRGLFLATIYHTEKDEDKKLYGNEEIRCKPEPNKTKNMKFANYDKINSEGLIPENTLVKDRDVIIGKVLPIKENKNDNTKTIKYSDVSIIYRSNEETYIDKNYVESNGDGYNFCKVRLRNYRKPVIGDKFSSRHGQKGTIGNIIPEKDMPFTADGLKPDIIINPHAIPSRMTIAQLKETLLGKVLLQLGLFGDGTSFCKFKIENITKELQKLGYESKGNEVLYNGLTGEQLSSSIFIGPAFYQRLKHMVNDKQHSRSIGPMVNLTRQPAEGRARDGGLRFGEMERDCMVSHGASRFTKGRIYDASDSYNLHICNKCGMIVSFNNKEKIHICKTCENRTDFKYIEIPYSCKLAFQELLTMNIAPRIICE
jgi:DNA-directed RNA polymerase II subunit RPB2